MYQSTFQNPANVPTPPTGEATFFLNALDNGKPYIKFNETTWVKLLMPGDLPSIPDVPIAKTTITFPNAANLDIDDVGKLLMLDSDGALKPTQSETISTGGYLNFRVRSDFKLIQQAKAEIVFADNPADGTVWRLNVNGKEEIYPAVAIPPLLDVNFTFKDTPAGGNDVQIGATLSDTLTNFAGVYNAMAGVNDLLLTKIADDKLLLDLYPEHFGRPQNINLWDKQISVSEASGASINIIQQPIYEGVRAAFTDDANTFTGSFTEMLLQQETGSGKEGTVKFGYIVPNNLAQLYGNMKITMEALFANVSCTYNAKYFYIKQNYIPIDEFEYLMGDIPSWIDSYEYSQPIAQEVPVQMVQKVIYGKLEAINNNGTIEVDMSGVYKLHIQGDVVFGSPKAALGSRVLLAKNDGELIPINSLLYGTETFDAAETFRKGGRNIFSAVKIYEALEEGMAGDKILVRELGFLLTDYLQVAVGL